MWQDYFAQHGYLEQTAGWQLALEGLLGEALTPVAFPEKASWKAMTKDGLPLLSTASCKSIWPKQRQPHSAAPSPSCSRASS